MQYNAAMVIAYQQTLLSPFQKVFKLLILRIQHPNSQSTFKLVSIWQLSFPRRKIVKGGQLVVSIAHAALRLPHKIK